MAVFDDDAVNERILLILILFLFVLLLIIILGIIFIQGFPEFTSLMHFFGSIIYNFGKSLSDIINTGGDILSNTGKFGITLSNNIVHDIGNMAKGEPTPYIDNGSEYKLDIAILKGPHNKEVV